MVSRMELSWYFVLLPQLLVMIITVVMTAIDEALAFITSCTHHNRKPAFAGCLQQVFTNHCLIITAGLVLVWLGGEESASHPVASIAWNEGFSTSFLKLVVSFLLFDWTFYAIHRGLHNSRWLYDHIHRRHHEAIEPYALTTFYAHPLQVLVLELPSITIGPTVMQMSAPLFQCWMVGVAILTHWQHMGGLRTYHPSLSAKHHLGHHQARGQNYGITSMPDLVMGYLEGLSRLDAD